MYELENDPTAADIIRRSLVCHPSLFADAMMAASKTHNEAASSMRMHQAVTVADRLAKACRKAAQLAMAQGDGALSAIMAAGPDAWISALNVARRLQCLPQNVASRAAERTGIAA